MTSQTFSPEFSKFPFEPSTKRPFAFKEFFFGAFFGVASAFVAFGFFFAAPTEDAPRETFESSWRSSPALETAMLVAPTLPRAPDAWNSPRVVCSNLKDAQPTTEAVRWSNWISTPVAWDASGLPVRSV